jgi:arginine kinase
VHIKLPNLSKNLDEFHKIAGKYNLQVRGSAGEHSEAVGGIYDISNKVSLGLGSASHPTAFACYISRQLK